MDDAIRQARAKLRFGPAAVDGQSAARLGARTSGEGSAGKTGAAAQVRGGRSFRIGTQFGIPSNARPASGRPHAAVGNMASICNLSGTRRNWSRGPTRLRPSSAADPADRRRSLAGRLHHAVRFGGAGGQEVTAASADRMPPPARSSVRPHLILWVNGATGYLPGPDSHGFTGRRMKQAMLGGCEAARRLSTSRKGTRPSGRISAPASSSRVT